MKENIRMLFAGFPCTEFSIAQKNKRINKIDFTAEEFLSWRAGVDNWWLYINEFEKQVSGKLGIENYEFAMGLHLFLNCLVALDRLSLENNEKIYFLFENVSSMQKGIKEVMSEIIGRLYGGYSIEINSALVSAQNRKRTYWTNIPGVEQPEDRGILLKDILESGIVDKEKSYCLKHQAGNARDYLKKKHTQVAFEPVRIPPYGNNEKSRPVNALYASHAGTGEGSLKGRLLSNNSSKQQVDLVAVPINPTLEGKSQTIKAQYGKTSLANTQYSASYGAKMVAEKTTGFSSKNIYEVVDGKITVKDRQYPINLPDGHYIIRKLTVNECCRLQTFPDNYFIKADGTPLVSNLQAYKQLGNSWTIEVIKHLLSHIPNLKDCDIEVLSMYDGISAGQLALKQLDLKVITYKSYEIDKYCLQTTQYHFPHTIQCGDAFQVRDTEWRF